jgi:hypothetical protein
MQHRVVCRGGPARHDGFEGLIQSDDNGYLLFDNPPAVYRITDEVQDTRKGAARVAHYMGTEVPK